MSGKPRYIFNAMRMVLLLACVLCTLAAHAQSGLVYVSGHGFSAGETLRQALADNQRSVADSFWVVITGADVTLFAREQAQADIQNLVYRVRERGGYVYVCDIDLATHRVTEDELLEGVARVRGYQLPELAGPAIRPAQEELVLPESIRESRLISKACADQRGS
jgi:hypothetical protein